MTERATEYKASNTVQGNMMTRIVRHPLIYTLHGLADELGLTIQTAFRGRAVLEERQWLYLQNSPLRRNALPAKLMEPSSGFWDDARQTAAFVDNLPKNDQWLFRDAVAQQELLDEYPKGEISRDIAEANFLGRAALLGEHYDLSEHVRWLGGVPGWKLLITATHVANKSGTQPPL